MSENSNIITMKTLPGGDWFLPSKDEVTAMYDELYLYDIGEFDDQGDFYWTSSEINASTAYEFDFENNEFYNYSKTKSNRVRACRKFTSTDVYALRDVGPAGGYIFWKSGNDYLEAASTDQSSGYAWSNIVDIALGTTGTAIGTGQANTTAIINQVGGANGWFLPSRDELGTMYSNLYLYLVGDFSASSYWVSNEYSATNGCKVNFATGLFSSESKSSALRVRACRFFTSLTSYNLRDVGPTGGWICYKNGNNYLEAAHTDQSSSQSWSNIINQEVGVYDASIGAGQANTNAIISQGGHINSAAKLCDVFDNLYGHINSAAKLCDDLI